MAAPASPRGGFSAEDLAGLPPEQRRKVLERNPQLAEALDEADKAARGASSRAARPRAGATDRAARRPGASGSEFLDKELPKLQKEAEERLAKEDAERSKRAASRRKSVSRGTRRVARETPGLPGPGASSLLLTFAGSTLAIVGLVLLLEGGPAFARLPAAVGTFAGRLTDPHDPIF